MKFISLSVAILFTTILSAFQLSKSNDYTLAPGMYRFSFVSTHVAGDDLAKGSWKKPLILNHNDHVAYHVVNNELIYKGYSDRKGNIQWKDTLILVPTTRLKEYAPVSKKVLDFNLVGVYYADRRFTDTFTVLYYSKKRNSIIEQLHVYTLNRMNFIAIYMNQPFHPFYDLDKYFKMADSAEIFHAPKQQIKFH